jgi:hypothetical protein
MMTAMLALALVGAFAWQLPQSGHPVGHGLPIDKINAALNDPIFAATKDMRAHKEAAITITEIGNGPETVVLTGDSLLFQFGPRVQNLYAHGLLHKHIVFVAGASCPAIPGIIRAGAYAPCREMPRIAAELIDRFNRLRKNHRTTAVS